MELTIFVNTLNLTPTTEHKVHVNHLPICSNNQYRMYQFLENTDIMTTCFIKYNHTWID